MVLSVVTASIVPAAQGGDAFGVGAELLQLTLGELVLDLLGRGRTGDRAELLAVQESGAGDVGVVGPDQQVLAGDEVRPGEGDLLLAVVGDRVGGEDHLDLATAADSVSRWADGASLISSRCSRAPWRRSWRRRRRSRCTCRPPCRPRPGWSNLIPMTLAAACRVRRRCRCRRHRRPAGGREVPLRGPGSDLVNFMAIPPLVELLVELLRSCRVPVSGSGSWTGSPWPDCSGRA